MDQTGNFPSYLTHDRKKLIIMEWSVAFFGILLVFLSMAGYFINTTCKQISELISEQNDAAEKVGWSLNYYYSLKQNELDNVNTPPELHDKIIEFSRRNATILYAVGRISSWGYTETLMEHLGSLKSTDGRTEDFNGKGFTLNPDFHTLDKVLPEVAYQIRLYQAIRDSAQNASAKWQGMIAVGTSYLLPVFYAVLGALVFTFRSWCSEHHQKRRIPRWPDHTSRWLMAGVAGIAIGVLNELFPKQILLSPLALAFLVGYSIEIFISWLDAAIKRLRKDEIDLTMHAHHAD